MTPEQVKDPNGGAAWLSFAADLMVRGVRDHKSAWHLLSLATASKDVGPDLRTVALRGIERETMRVEFWTDRRSAKVPALGGGAAVMFWDRRSHIQLRLRGSVELAGVEEPEVQSLVATLPEGALRNYATLAPPGDAPFPGARDADERGGRTLAEANFLRCRVMPSEGDLVHLGQERHRRFAYTFAPFGWREVTP